MEKKVVITIARQYCSGGLKVGKRLAEELGIPMEDVRKDGPGSWLLCGDIQSAMRGESDA